MDLSLILGVLRRRWLTVTIGLLVAAAAAVFSGYELVDGSLVSRADPEFESVARVLIAVPDQELFAIGSQPIIDPVTGAPLELANGYDPQELAEIYAFLVISDDMRARIEAVAGELGAGEGIDAARRRVGPSEDEADAPSNSVLPILEITATARSGQRAVELAESATDAFVSYVREQQTVQAVLPALRVDPQVIDAATGAKDQSGSATGTVAVVFLGIFFSYLSLAFARDNRLRNAAATARAADVRWMNVVVPVGDPTGTLPTMIRELEPDEGRRLAAEPHPEVPRVDTADGYTHDGSAFGDHDHEDVAEPSPPPAPPSTVVGEPTHRRVDTSARAWLFPQALGERAPAEPDGAPAAPLVSAPLAPSSEPQPSDAVDDEPPR